MLDCIAMVRIGIIHLLAGLALLPASVLAQQNPDALTFPSSWTNTFSWRSIGPAGMGGRVTSIAVNAQDPSNYFVGMATAGVIRTKNNGVTFEAIFQDQPVSSVGDVEVSPSHPNIVWVGTGEANPRNSVSYGNGVYKSTNGGDTWTHMGLKDSFQIGKIMIHPKNPDIVYVGALGRLWGPNAERGLFKTTDGGKTWSRVHFVNSNTGVIDGVMNPRDPDEIVIATWERRRNEYDSMEGTPKLPDGYDGYDPIVKWGHGSGLWKTTDGGKTWTRLGKGLPTGKLGRIGLDVWQKDPKVLVAIIDGEDIGKGARPPRVTGGFDGKNVAKGIEVTSIVSSGAFAAAGIKVGDVITAVGGKSTTTLRSYYDTTRDLRSNTPTDVSFIRDGKSQTVKVNFRTNPSSASMMITMRGSLGLGTEEVGGGVRITQVRAESIAAKAGLKVGDIITKFEGKENPVSADISAILSERELGATLNITVKREDQTVDVQLKTEAPETSSTRFYTSMLGGQAANIQDMQGDNGHQYGGVYRSDDGGASWRRLNSLNPRPMYFSKIKIDPQDDRFLYVGGISFHRSVDGGQTFTADAGNRVHADQHAIWVNPADGRNILVGTDGGWYASYDRTTTWEHENNMPLAQFYHITVDNRAPYWVAGGLQDNGSWAGPSMTRNGGPVNENWLSLNGGDGFVCRIDPSDPNIIYAESQGGVMVRRNLATGEFASIRPLPEQGFTWRFNWNTPFILSAHNPRVFIAGGNYVFRSLDRGNNLRRISPEIVRTGHGSATAVSESPLNPNVLWAGTDDGYLWLTRDNGATWNNLTEKLGLKGYRWVGTIEASRFREGRAYVCLTAQRSDDDKPYLFMTDDFGQTWKSISGGLPQFGTTRTLREDIENPDLLYCGTEFGVFVSLDRGISWQRINNNLPTVPVHEIAVHPVAGEIVVGTHGRSAWIVDVSALRQFTGRNLRNKAHLYAPQAATVWRRDPRLGVGDGHEKYFGENPVLGATIWYHLLEKQENVEVEIFDAMGRSVRRFGNVPGEAGLQRIVWPLSGTQTRPGTYRVELRVGQTKISQPLVVNVDPLLAEQGMEIPGVDNVMELTKEEKAAKRR